MAKKASKKTENKKSKETPENKKEKIRAGIYTASLWLYHVICFVLIIISYWMLPTFYNAVSQNAWAVIAGIVLIPLAIAIFGGALILSIIDLIRSIISKKWWHITISAVEIILIVLTVLTTFNVIPSII